MDSFSNIMNIRDLNYYQFGLASSLLSFSRVDDSQFSWLSNVFFKCFGKWLTSIEQCPGYFSKNAKGRTYPNKMKG